MGKKRKCYLQTCVETDGTEGMFDVLKRQKYWTITEVTDPFKEYGLIGFKYKNLLIEFESMSDKKKYIKEYCTGRGQGTNTFAVRMSPWPSVQFYETRQAIFTLKSSLDS